MTQQNQFICLTLFGLLSIGFYHPAWSSSMLDLVTESDLPETTTAQIDSTCRTRKGETGTCEDLYECYPLLLKGESEYSEDEFAHLNSTLDEWAKIHGWKNNDSSFGGLYEEIWNNVKSKACPILSEGRFRVCCPDSQDTLIINDDEASEETTFVRDLSQDDTSCGLANQLRSSWTAIDNKTLKVTGGTYAKPGQFPWMVAIFGKNKKQTCGGSLLNHQYVLTAAHCMFTYTTDDLQHLTLHIGDYNIRSISDGQHETRKISKIILHRGFNSKSYHNDIALLKLDNPVEYNQKIQPICLPSKNTDIGGIEGKTVTVMGWGRDRSWGQASEVLRYTEMPMWKLSECKRVFNRFAPNRLQDSNICAGDGRRNKDACIGDSGGPLVYRVDTQWVQLGIVSWGKGCGSFPGAYTSTYSFLQWVEKNIHGKTESVTNS